MLARARSLRVVLMVMGERLMLGVLLAAVGVWR